MVRGRLAGVTVLADYPVVARNIDPASDNKIHDDEVARQFGFTGALVPGVELFAYLTHPLVEAWGTGFLSSAGIEVRFRQPVYDDERVVAHCAPSGPDGVVALELRGPDDSIRSVGRATPTDVGRPEGLERLVDTPLPVTLLQPTAESLRPGPLGSIVEKVDEAASASYLQAISETLPIYREQSLVHPGSLLRMVNALLVRNVELGPWIHTASRCVLLGLARVPSTLRAHGIVTETFERNGNDYVRYDALVLSDEQPVMYVEHTAIYAVQGPRRSS
jgi:hypothetical protein